MKKSGKVGKSGRSATTSQSLFHQPSGVFPKSLFAFGLCKFDSLWDPHDENVYAMPPGHESFVTGILPPPGEVWISGNTNRSHAEALTLAYFSTPSGLQGKIHEHTRSQSPTRPTPTVIRKDFLFRQPPPLHSDFKWVGQQIEVFTPSRTPTPSYLSYLHTKTP